LKKNEWQLKKIPSSKEGFFFAFPSILHTLVPMLQDEVFDILTMGYNTFLTGAAGSGKTFLVNRFIRHCHEHGIGVAVTASTGIAATHIGGMTIHSWSGMGIRDTLTQEDLEYILAREYLIKRFAKTSVLIIDEISMLGGNFLESLDILLQRARVSPEPFGGIQILLVGDFFQLPPVSRDAYVEYAFEHPSWRSFKLAHCVLSTQYRQKSEVNSSRHLSLRRIQSPRPDSSLRMTESKIHFFQFSMKSDPEE
jgi:ATP-dependent DNA helicase PIF1